MSGEVPEGKKTGWAKVTPFLTDPPTSATG
jgi:hypothetical protein